VKLQQNAMDIQELLCMVAVVLHLSEGSADIERGELKNLVIFKLWSSDM